MESLEETQDGLAVSESLEETLLYRDPWGNQDGIAV